MKNKSKIKKFKSLVDTSTEMVEVNGVTYKRLTGLDHPEFGVSRCGLVINLKTGRNIGSPHMPKNKYMKTNIPNTNDIMCFWFVHQLVALAFVPGYQPDLMVNHLDGNGFNNNADNLEWTTSRGNSDHAIGVLGTHPGKLTEEQAKKMVMEPYYQGCYKDYATQFNCTEATIRRIFAGYRRPYLQPYVHASHHQQLIFYPTSTIIASQ